MVTGLIPVCEPAVPKRAQEYVRSAIAANWVGSTVTDQRWDFISKLETEFAAVSGCSQAVAVTSGTTALRLTWAALRLGPGDEVIVPALTMIAVASTLVEAGATPVFADIDPNDWCIDVEQVRKLISGRTKAVVAAHSYGQPPRLDWLRRLTEDNHLYLVEDAAQGLGATCFNRPAGGWGDVACFSLYANKLVTAGEGGILASSSTDVIDRARFLKDHAFSKPRFVHDELGFNFRMNNLSAAYACASLEELEYNLKQKKQIAAWYREELADISDIRLPPKLPGRESSYWMFGILLASSADRDSVSKRMREQFHVDSRPFFHPLHVQVPLRKYHRGKADLPIAMSMGRSGLYLPSGTTLRREEITSVACALRCSLGKT